MSGNENLEELTEKEMGKVLAALFKRSQTDREFRNLCIKNPEEVIFEISGKKPPGGKKIKFVEHEEKNESQ